RDLFVARLPGAQAGKGEGPQPVPPELPPPRPAEIAAPRAPPSRGADPAGPRRPRRTPGADRPRVLSVQLLPRSARHRSLRLPPVQRARDGGARGAGPALGARPAAWRG